MFNTTPITEISEKALLGAGNHQWKHDQSSEFWRDYYLAGDHATPAGKLVTLAQHQDPIIRKRVAENLHLPAYIQWLLVADKDINVRLALTANPSTLVDVLNYLAGDESQLVRFSLARNKNMPVPALINLARDKQANISGQAQETIEEIFGSARLRTA